MQNGLHKILSYVLGVIKLYKGPKGATLWLVFVEKAFVICAVNHGNQIIKIILNVISLRRKMMTKSVDRRLSLRS